MAMYTCKMLTDSLTKYFANACIHRLKEMWKMEIWKSLMRFFIFTEMDA